MLLRHPMGALDELLVLSFLVGSVQANPLSHKGPVPRQGSGVHCRGWSCQAPKGCGCSRLGGTGLAHLQVPRFSLLAALGIKKIS